MERPRKWTKEKVSALIILVRCFLYRDNLGMTDVIYGTGRTDRQTFPTLKSTRLQVFHKVVIFKSIFILKSSKLLFSVGNESSSHFYKVIFVWSKRKLYYFYLSYVLSAANCYLDFKLP